ncbi:TOMM precursor leader peptide-binding protein [Streptomyces pathocidini]|uniref:TOMM leader peptide-binding protein n=1 Tax=Streptomyces pathocidini TaxID=1650571 RepID=A0ABW7UMR9_9ACTN|nr:TOMM precursor leader peptide-binding protein [Streptomyces pathocidini]
MHPMLKPALRRAWRDRQTVQFGVAGAHAVVLGPVDTATGSFLTLLDGTRGLPLLRREAAAMGLPPGQVDELVDRLGAAGLLEDATAADRPRAEPAQPRGSWDRLRPDLASLSVVHPEPDAAARQLAARAGARVQVRGLGRVGAAVAAVLSASGVGQVDVRDGGCVEPWDAGPPGLPPESVGERRSLAAQRVVRAAAPVPPPRRRAAPGRATVAAEPATALVVLAPRDGLAAYAPDPDVTAELIAAGTPHLYAGVIEGTGVVGPLVLPGESACAGCLALERAEREPAWPRMLAQWRSGRGNSGALACDTSLATVVAGLAASHALTFLEGRVPASAGARLEFALPDLAWEPRQVVPHPDCGCGAAPRTEVPESAELAEPPEVPEVSELPEDSGGSEVGGLAAGNPPLERTEGTGQ